MTIKIEANQRLAAAIPVSAAVSGKEACKIVEGVFAKFDIKIKARMLDDDEIQCTGKFKREKFQFSFAFMTDTQAKQRKDFGLDFNWQPSFDLPEMWDAAVPDFASNTKQTAKEFEKAANAMSKLRKEITENMEDYETFMSNMADAMNKIANLVAENKETK